jgi:hypothetical protein
MSVCPPYNCPAALHFRAGSGIPFFRSQRISAARPSRSLGHPEAWHALTEAILSSEREELNSEAIGNDNVSCLHADLCATASHAGKVVARASVAFCCGVAVAL